MRVASLSRIDFPVSIGHGMLMFTVSPELIFTYGSRNERDHACP